MRRIFLLLLLSLISTSAFTASAQNAPVTARDYFFALPDRYFSLDCCMHLPRSQRKAEYLKRYKNVEDIANGFMSGYGDAAQEGFEMALFKRANGTYLIGFYTYGEGGVEDTPWTVFLDYSKGRWADVSRKVIPNYNKEKYIYLLPRVGTSIQVFQKDENGEDWYRGKKLYDLVWSKSRFVRSK